MLGWREQGRADLSNFIISISQVGSQGTMSTWPPRPTVLRFRTGLPEIRSCFQAGRTENWRIDTG